MAYSAIAVANAFIEKAKNGCIFNLSHMKLQKLLFFAQSWHLRIFETPLIDDDFEKWAYGPVLLSIHTNLKSIGHESRNDINCILGEIDTDINGNYFSIVPQVDCNDVNAVRIISSISSVYGKMSAFELSRATHLPNSAWSKTVGLNNIIQKNLMSSCTVTEEGRFLGAKDFSLEFDIDKIELCLSQDFIEIPNDLSTIEEFDRWLDEATRN